MMRTIASLCAASAVLLSATAALSDGMAPAPTVSGGSYDDYIFRSPYQPAYRYQCGYGEGYYGTYRYDHPWYHPDLAPRPSKFGPGYVPYPAAPYAPYAPYPPLAPVPAVCPPNYPGR